MFNLSTDVLTFSRNKASTQKIDINLIGLFCMEVKFSDNLPRCFKISRTETALIFKNDSFRVIYDGSHDFEVSFTEGMHIQISENSNEANRFQKVIEVKFEEEKLDGLECKICLQKFSDEIKDRTPRILSNCGHTLCDKCIKTLIRNSENRYIQCPFDRVDTDTLGYSEYLPKNFTVLDILREQKETEKQKKVNEPVCCDDPDVPCYENAKHESTSYCTTCKENFCQNCFTSTHSSRILSNHKSIPISERPIVLPNCLAHPNNVLEFLCKGENQEFDLNPRLMCHECSNDEHKNHKHESYIDIVTKNHETLEKLTDKLRGAEDTIRERNEKIEECVDSFEKTDSCYLAKVESIKAYFDKKKEEALKKLEDFVDSRKEKLEDEKEKNEDTLGWTVHVRKEVEKIFKRKMPFHNIDLFIQYGETPLLQNSGNYEKYIPFSAYSFPDDMNLNQAPSTSTQTSSLKRKLDSDEDIAGPSNRPMSKISKDENFIQID